MLPLLSIDAVSFTDYVRYFVIALCQAIACLGCRSGVTAETYVYLRKNFVVSVLVSVRLQSKRREAWQAFQYISHR